jgi:hypothetical protein
MAALPAVQFLVDAVGDLVPQRLPALPRPAPRRSFDERMRWATELHARLVDHDHRALR